jgi:hypothetical protein
MNDLWMQKKILLIFNAFEVRDMHGKFRAKNIWTGMQKLTLGRKSLEVWNAVFVVQRRKTFLSKI